MKRTISATSAILASAMLSASSFSVILIPDTQHCTLAEFQSMGSWIKTNASAINLQAVIGLGDIVQNPGTASEWTNSTNLYYHIMDTVPTLPVIGNHDYDDLNQFDGMTNRATTIYNSYYGQSYYTNRSWWTDAGFYDASLSENWYWRKNFGGSDWLVFGLEFGPRDSVLNWVSNTAASFPNDKVMISTHSYVRESGWQAGTDPANDPWNPDTFLTDANDGKDCWYKAFRTITNLFLVVNGHHPDCDDTQIRRSVAIGDRGNHVMQSLADFQLCASGSWIRILTFDPVTWECDVTSYQTSTGTYNTAAPHQFSFMAFASGENSYGSVFGLNDIPYLAAAASTPSPLLTSIAAYWKLQESSGNRLDSVGSSTLTSNGGTGSGTGVVGNGATFNGSQSLSRADNAAVSIGTGVNYTLAAWVKLTSLAADRTIVSKADGTVAATIEYVLRYSSSFNRFRFSTSDGTTVTGLNADAFGAPSTNTWYFVAAGWRSGTNFVQVNNGTENVVATANGTWDSTSSFFTGDWPAVVPNTMLGSIDEAGIWKRTLTPGELSTLYNSGTGNTYPF